jgi:hypothetical protein|tara:strand:- start:1553 stop:1753 length:201 start_codon:yes stop_codon:yes gene_type:complete
MKCNECGTRLRGAINADVYACFSCQVAYSGIDVRNKGAVKNKTERVGEAKKYYKVVGEKIKRGEKI